MMIIITVLIMSWFQDTISLPNFRLIDKCEVITDLGFSQGCAWGDYNNDGYVDLFVTNNWIPTPNLFYKNNGDGTFTKLTMKPIAFLGEYSNGCTWGDYNNDGLLDLYVANVNNKVNYFFENKGNDVFLQIKNQCLVTDTFWSYGCTWGDYDNDGYLDLYVSNYKNQENILYHNNGGKYFSRVLHENIISIKKNSQNAVWADFNNDGYVDLVVANKEANDFYVNTTKGSFKKISNDFTKEYKNSFGISVADFNNDGLLDIFVANWYDANSLFENLGDFQFKKIKIQNLNSPSYTEGSAWGDVNNDGKIDLFITNDGVNVLYLNKGDNTFIAFDTLNISIDGKNSNGCTFADYDNDGFLDLFIANGGNQTNLLYHNEGNNNNWIEIKCVGTIHNASGIGTRVSVLSTIDGRKIWQHQEVLSQTGGGYGGQNPLTLHFGLQQSNKVDSIIVKWGNNKVQYLTNVSVNQVIKVFEER